MIGFTKNWGMYLSKESSWNEQYYLKALADRRL